MKSVMRLPALLLLILFLPLALFGQERQKQSTKTLTREDIKELEKKGIRPPSGIQFTLNRVEGTPSFTALLSDQNNRVATAIFYLPQLTSFEAVLLEAQKFAETNESAGAAKPITTRFFDKNEPTLIVDVMKQGQESRLFITLRGFNGPVTVDAGAIKRGDRDQKRSGLFFDVLAGIQNAKSLVSPQ